MKTKHSPVGIRRALEQAGVPLKLVRQLPYVRGTAHIAWDIGDMREVREFANGELWVDGKQVAVVPSLPAGTVTISAAELVRLREVERCARLLTSMSPDGAQTRHAREALLVALELERGTSQIAQEGLHLHGVTGRETHESRQALRSLKN